MAKFVLMTKLAPGAVQDAAGRRAVGRAWLDKVRKHAPDVKFVAHYAIFGAYDFMDIYEADNVDSAQKVALVSRSDGAVSVETWQALPYEEFLGMLDAVNQ